MSYVDILDEIGPVQPKKPSNRGRKPMKSTILTSPENVATLQEKRDKTPAKKTPAKRTIKKTPTLPTPASKRAKTKGLLAGSSPSSASEDDGFCIICLKKLPEK